MYYNQFVFGLFALWATICGRGTSPSLALWLVGAAEGVASPLATTALSKTGGSEADLDERQSRLEELFRQHSYRVLAYACRRGASQAEAEDVVSETFLVCWRRLEVVPDDALPWLLGVAHKVLANHWRSVRRRDALVARMAHHVSFLGGAPSGPLEPANPESPTIAAFARLPEKDREVLILVAWDGLTHKQGAQVLGCSPTAFAVRAHRARKRLLKEIECVRTSSGIDAALDKRGP